MTSKRKGVQRRVDEEALGVHQLVRFSLSLSSTRTPTTLLARCHRRSVPRESSRKTMRRRKEYRRNERKWVRKIRVMIVRLTMVMEHSRSQRSVRERKRSNTPLLSFVLVSLYTSHDYYYSYSSLVDCFGNGVDSVNNLYIYKQHY